MSLMNKILESDYGKEFFNQNIYLINHADKHSTSILIGKFYEMT